MRSKNAHAGILYLLLLFISYFMWLFFSVNIHGVLTETQMWSVYSDVHHYKVIHYINQ